jgi:hypothetical protein
VGETPDGADDGRERPKRRGDPFLDEYEKLFGGPMPERRKGPPPRRPRGWVLAWLGRVKLWDDVFTRTLSGVQTVSIIYIFGVIAGFFRLDRQAVRSSRSLALDRTRRSNLDPREGLFR